MQFFDSGPWKKDKLNANATFRVSYIEVIYFSTDLDL